MCITFFQLNPDEKDPKQFKLILAFNRDQRLNRKTLQLDQFEDDENIYGGRDLEYQGTWFGINVQTGMVAFLTNYDTQEWHDVTDAKYGRGYLTVRFLKTEFFHQKEKLQELKEDPKQQTITDTKNIEEKIISELNLVLSQRQKYNAFNLVVGNINTGNFYYICNKVGYELPLHLKPGVYGLCNTDLLTIWPKTNHGLKIFEDIIQNQPDVEQIDDLKKCLFTLLTDSKLHSQNPQDESSIFVKQYKSELFKAERGTLSSTVLLVDSSNKITLIQDFRYNGQKQINDLGLRREFKLEFSS